MGEKGFTSKYLVNKADTLDPFTRELMMEDDIHRMKKKYKNMERDKHLESKGCKFSKQKKLISILRKENNNITVDLDVATGSSNIKKNTAVSAKLLMMLEDYDRVNADIKEKKTILNEIEYQIKRNANKVIDLQAKQTTDLQHQNRVLEGQKTVEKLENRLCTVTRAFCTSLEQNRKLREEIEHYLLERTYFNNLWETYIRKLNIGKKIMMDLIEQATIAYDQREEWVQNVKALQDKSKLDCAIQYGEMSLLDTEIMHNRKLEEFLQIKNQKRIMLDLEEKLVKKRRKNKEAIQQKVEEYNALLQEVKEFTGQDDMYSLAHQYLLSEEENFAKYLYTNELTADMEQMSTKLHHYRKKVDEEREKNDNEEKHQKETIENLQMQLKQATDETEAAETNYKATQTKLNDLLKGIDRLFKICKCSNAPLLELLGNNSTIKKFNAITYLNVLEQRVSEMMRNVCFRQKYDRRLKNHIVMDRVRRVELDVIFASVPSTPCPLCMETAFCADMVEKAVPPLEKEQVVSKINAYLSIPDAVDLVHNVSACHLPKSRQIIQRRYQ